MDITTRQNNIDRFEQLLMSTNRDGVDKLVEFLRKSDFYTAPASTKYHLSCEGGLLQHSLNVYDALISKAKNNPTWQQDFNPASLIVTALLHDLCKTYFYVSEVKNRKVYKENGSKMDSNGRYDWESYMGYTIEDQFPYGHGEKSVMMIEQFIKLTPEERYAIRWHMGFSEPKENWNSLGKTYEKYPLALALSEADLEATYLMEKEDTANV